MPFGASAAYSPHRPLWHASSLPKRGGELMARPLTGEVIERKRKRGRVFALRFRAYGQRHYITLGRAAEGWTRRKAEDELQNILADVRRGTWQPPQPETEVEAPPPMPAFHAFASRW